MSTEVVETKVLETKVLNLEPPKVQLDPAHRLIDTHCHIHDLEAFPDPDAVIQAAKDAGIGKIIVVGVSPDDWPRAVAFAERYEGVYAICGWHPNYTADYDPIDLPKLIKYLHRPKVIAIGEIGLDYHWDYSPTTQQHKALRDQLRLAQEMNMPVVFHAREAYADLLDVLEKLKAKSPPEMPPLKYLMHCFAGTLDDARRALRLGCFFGVDGPITYKKADDLRAVIKLIPPHKLLLETDSPYMSPVPYRGKPNQPAYIPIINRAVAELHRMSEDEFAEQAFLNCKDFFGI